jgi:hypothetical protein
MTPVMETVNSYDGRCVLEESGGRPDLGWRTAPPGKVTADAPLREGGHNQSAATG